MHRKLPNRCCRKGRFWAYPALFVLLTSLCPAAAPNIILMMADDLGYGDTGFNGNTVIQTPHLDQLARDGALLRHFYANGPVCSPTRGTCLTGRHYYRYGIYTANVGNLPRQEITLARILKENGYATGHFGKWHLGTLSKTLSSKGEKRKPEINYSPPWERDYDRSFVTESAVSTWNPGIGKRARNNPFYDDGVPLDGDDASLLGGAARVIVDRAVPFMEKAVAEDQPFLAVVWFHAPHEEILAGPEYLAMYPDAGAAAHYYGCITELDEQVGRIRQTLERLGVADNTLIFFCSDNGPEGKEAKGKRAGVTNGLRGRKRSLYDGGVRVPALAAWPGVIKAGSVVDTPMSTLDYFPTVAGIIGYEMPDDRPVDGEDILPILMGKRSTHEKPIPFRFRDGATLVKGTHKLVLPEGELYDLSSDWSEENDISETDPERVAAMTQELMDYLEAFKASHGGADYNDPAYRPTGKWRNFNPETTN
jgi:arylsulfatase A-like enzyme